MSKLLNKIDCFFFLLLLINRDNCCLGIPSAFFFFFFPILEYINLFKPWSNLSAGA